MNGVCPLFFGPLLFAMWPLPQGDVPVQSGEIELRVEMRQGGSWQGVDAHTVFRNKDEIRFAFRSSFPGYLRVVNHSSDGQTAPLFPLADSKQPTAQVLANTDYFIPGTKGSFVVAGKPGFDLTEWFMSSVLLEGDWQATEPSPETGKLLPKCPHEEPQGRRTCLDSRAGPSLAPLPEAQEGLVSRDLNFGSRDLSSLIRVPDTSRKLVVYEFRVAHH